MMLNVNVIAAITLLLDKKDEEKENVRECSPWVRPWIARRESDGAFLHHLLRAGTRGC